MNISEFPKSVSRFKEDTVKYSASLYDKINDIHRLAYKQYKNRFKEFSLVYQPMINCSTGSNTNYEVFLRWSSKALGEVSPIKTIECFDELGLSRQLNEWIIKNTCKTFHKFIKEIKETPIIHINYPSSEIGDIKIADMILKYTKKYDIPPERICLELDGSQVYKNIDDICLFKKTGIKICIDHFEDKEEENEILDSIVPDYVKMSSKTLYTDIFATNDEEKKQFESDMLSYFKEIIIKCAKKNIKTCICGIETEKHNKMISELGFDLKQGYYFAKPKKLSL